MNTVQNGKESVRLDAENWGGFCVRRIRYRNICNSDDDNDNNNDDDDNDNNNNNNNNNRFQKCGHCI
jgi:hypothetical protein